MSLARYLKVFFGTLPIFLAVDAVWLVAVARKFYDQQLAGFERTVRWPSAILVYLVLVAGCVLFTVPLAGGSPGKAFLFGAALGLVAYGTYDLTNYALLKQWPLAMTIADMAWGAAVQGFTAVIATLINKRLG
jgi:uncharacterized membrane protein